MAFPVKDESKTREAAGSGCSPGVAGSGPVHPKLPLFYVPGCHPFLPQAVVFDEFHERSVDADLALALCREAQQVLWPA
mgnify:CR=1 FL=1